MHKWRNSVVILCPMFIPFTIVFAIYHLKNKQNGKLWSKETSIFFKTSDTFNYKIFLILFMRSFTAVMLNVGIALTTYFCKMIHVSPAAIQSFSTMSAFTTAFLFYKLYGEKLNIQHKIGMMLIVASVFIVAISKSM